MNWKLKTVMHVHYQIQEIMHKRDLGQGYGQIAKAMGMSRSTVSTIVKRELNAVVGIQ